MPDPPQTEWDDPDAGKGLHQDEAAPFSFLERYAPVLNSLPLLWSFIKVLPAFGSGAFVAFICFAFGWGWQGLREDVTPYIPLNAFLLTLLAVGFNAWKARSAQAAEVKEARRTHSEGQLNTKILYRAPRLD
eukprot:TRINITY_DN20503_c0_g1_i2.p2 TRINITY_DN20503_c0_g1~~TRINITY_DN20503_c0_g1_i2.p2  ORF type:complete len:147 (+),score=30.51 TRINITY_DN20503_c0_g1_i2:47-442(+)